MNNFKTTTLSLATIAAIALTGCGGGSDSAAAAAATPNCDSSYTVLSSNIDANLTLDKTKVYGLDGKVKVTNNAVLTIPAGTTIAGCTAASFMVITPGSQIVANGTLAEPIVFTSQKDQLGNSADNKAGEWGGLVLAGNAYTHKGTLGYEADETVQFGRADHTKDSESSGILNYVVIKHSGYEVEKDKELNGLSLAGVGSGTTLTNIAIIGGLDDGLEIWGGTPNITGLYVYNAQDDSVDTDLGYRGTITNTLVKQVNVDKTNAYDSSTMEFGNDNDTITTDDTNATQPIMVNFTGYIKGGGLYNKYDAGFRWTNVQFISSKTVDQFQVVFRGIDSATTGAKHIDGNVSFYNSAVTFNNTDGTTPSDVYSLANTKDTNTTYNAYKYFTNDINVTGTLLLDNNASGVDETIVWKGKAGDNTPLEN